MAEQWVVLLEAVAGGQPAVDHHMVDRLLEQVEDCCPRALHAAGRYALQLLLVADSPLKAHEVAVERWRRALRAIGAPAWPVARVEVMTLAEFESDCRAVTGDHPLPVAAVSGPCTVTAADDMLRAVFHDPLTALPTAELFRAKVQEILGPSRRSADRHAMLMLQILVNTVSPGLAFAGLHDLVVVEIVRRLVGVFRRNDIVARVGRGTFAVLITNVGECDAATLAERVLATVSGAGPEGGSHLLLRGSVGIALSQGGRDADRLFAAATAAREAATRGGGGRWELFRPGLTRGALPADATQTESCADDC